MNNNVTHAVSQETVELIYNIIQITKWVLSEEEKRNQADKKILLQVR